MPPGWNNRWHKNERRQQASKRKPQASALAHTKHDWQFHNISRAMTQTQITEAAAHFAESLRFGDTSEAAVKIARFCVIDGVGLIIDGSDEHSVQILTEQACLQGGTAEVALPGAQSVKVPASVAARVMSASSSAHDWDDTQVSRNPAQRYGLLTHPVIPPLTATRIMSEELGGVSGAQFAGACLAGFNDECKLSEWTFPHMYKSGFHPSGTAAGSGPALPNWRRARGSRASFGSLRRLIAQPRLKNRPSMALRFNFDRMNPAQKVKVVFAARIEEVVKATTKGDS